MPSKKLSLLIIPTVSITLTLLFFLIYPSAETIKTHKLSTTKTNTELINYIDQYNSLIFNVNHQLRINNYPVVVDYSISSDEKIELSIKINQENTKKTIENIEKITIDTIKQNKFDPALFNIDITKYNEPFFEKNTTSTRLSYNDLTGYIGEKLFVKYNLPLSLHHEVLPENVKITLNLPTDYQTYNIKIKNTILDIIEQHNFDPNLFQIDITNNIKNN